MFDAQCAGAKGGVDSVRLRFKTARPIGVVIDDANRPGQRLRLADQPNSPWDLSQASALETASSRSFVVLLPEPKFRPTAFSSTPKAKSQYRVSPNETRRSSSTTPSTRASRGFPASVAYCHKTP